MDKSYANYFKDKVVLVTGGTGSIGSEIVRKLLAFPLKQVRIFSRDEFKQYNLGMALKDQPAGRVSFLIGDIRDRDRIFLAMEGVNVVFNAAAMKHVPLCEYNPFEAVKTNVLGTQNVVDACRANNVEKFVHVSTDKAAFPSNVMGATKLLAEKIALAAANYKGPHKTIYSCVRFGNVFGSRGSVVPLFVQQIRDGNSVTVTDKEMTRFIMRIPEAAELVIKAGVLSNGEELFILKMPVMKINDLANAMIDLLAPRFNRRPGEIEVKIIGRRDGEKLYELLMTEDEAGSIYENDEMICISKKPLDGFIQSKTKNYRSDQCQLMKPEEIREFLKPSLEALEKLI